VHLRFFHCEGPVLQAALEAAEPLAAGEHETHGSDADEVLSQKPVEEFGIVLLSRARPALH
jgi:hypothetical protein